MLVASVHVCLPLSEEFDNIIIFEVNGCFKSCSLFQGITVVYTHPRLIEQEVDNIDLSTIDGEYEGVPSIYVHGISICLMLLHEVLNNLNAAKVTCSVQWSPPVFVERCLHQ